MGRHNESLPCERHKYNKIVGDLLQDTVEEILSSLGYDVKVNPLQANDVDLWIYQDSKLVARACAEHNISVVEAYECC